MNPRSIKTMLCARMLALTVLLSPSAVLSADWDEGRQATADPARDEVCREDSGKLLLHVPSPDWAGQVIYMVFIDRFSDGDKSNNDFGAGEYDPTSGSHFNGGDLQGIIDQLDYLKALGVTALWISPPVRNQWWSTPYAAAGWHGYWAENFAEVDPHFGDLALYQRLSHELHCRGMYLIQDIVINHVGNYYEYDGPWNPEDPTENFKLIEAEHGGPVAPTQPPFDMIDPRNPEHREADIYHWTPAITDYEDPVQQGTWSFGLLGDIKTSNPVVLTTFKDTYGDWIENVGVDGFRVDTAFYVDQPFWHHFFEDDDGIWARARDTGREHFLAFGEVLVPSEPFATDGEQMVGAYMETSEVGGFNSMLNFPLYFSLRRVLGEGQPPAQLAYRLQRHMDQFPDPQVLPTFIDNHDTARFLATSSEAAFRQALMLIYTIPGIPSIYMGTEQAVPEARQALFPGGWMSSGDLLDKGSETYAMLASLGQLRSDNPALVKGDLNIIAANASAPGLLAYGRSLADDQLLIMMNTADHSILAHRLDAGLSPGQTLEWVGGDHSGEALVADARADARGYINVTMPPRATWVLRPGEITGATVNVTPVPVTVSNAPGSDPLEQDFLLAGRIDQAGAQLQLLINGNLDRAISFRADEQGEWSVNLPVRDLGQSSDSFQIYHPASNSLTAQQPFITNVSKAEIEFSIEDPQDDGHGPDGSYRSPLQPESGEQREIQRATVRVAGRNLELTLKMAEVTTPWVPPNGFDNVAFTTFISMPGGIGVQPLPLLNADMPGGLSWNLGHFATGWMSYAYSAEGASARHQGKKLGVAPTIRGDEAASTVTLFFDGEMLGVDDWSGAHLYITSWDANGEGTYAGLAEEPGQWTVLGPANGAKIMDDLLIAIP